MVWNSEPEKKPQSFEIQQIILEFDVKEKCTLSSSEAKKKLNENSISAVLFESFCTVQSDDNIICNIFFFADYIHTECFCDCELQILGNNIQNSESAGGHHF